ncbi:iron-containing redox enzyme family protein [Methylomarinum sp. Ch1-1]|uniref:Iron-containing redox enzyme family protein n=1 Tax=Methylomarinum roseum TaxID=3067653 RepID=A0AAU7NR66_9GAMM
MSRAADLPFKPSSATGQSVTSVSIGGRALFYRLLHFNVFLDNQQLAQAFLNQSLERAGRHYYNRYTELGDDPMASLTVESNIEPMSVGEAGFVESLRQSAPVLLTEPCWLQDVCQATSNQEVTAAALMRVYLALSAAHLDDAYRALLAQFGLASPPLHSASYSQRKDLLSGFIDFAAVQLALADNPRRYEAELLGFTLAYCRSSTPVEQYFPDQTGQTDFFRRRRALLACQSEGVARMLDDWLALNAGPKAQAWQRIQAGFWLYRDLVERCRSQLGRHLLHHPSATEAMLQLLQRKTAAAIGHHHRVQLQGQNLDDWFRGLPETGGELLTALRRSSYVDAAEPQNSRLLKLFEFNGPMFGILDQQELAVVKNWLSDQSTATAEPLNPRSDHEDRPVRFVVSKSEDLGRLSNRQLYYYLLNAEYYPQVLPPAAAKVSRQLAIFGRLSRLPFKRYSHARFERYLHATYQHEMAAYRPLSGKPNISRAAYRWGLKQIAPTVLIDGVWLQHCSRLRCSHPEIAAILTGIYADELGRGRLQQSHPVVFSNLLEALGIDLPPIASKAFSEHENFVDSAFDLPVFMLALAKFPQRFLPELLGLNMAIELSGLGRGYLSLIDELNYWGIDATIARLHVTIDNFADGHAAQAKEAIKLYLDEVLVGQGEQAMQQHWRRIFSGYVSLNRICWRFKLAVPAVYMFNKMTRRSLISDNNNKKNSSL